MKDWGTTMLGKYDTTRLEDYTTKHLGFSTDNGAYVILSPSHRTASLLLVLLLILTQLQPLTTFSMADGICETVLKILLKMADAACVVCGAGTTTTTTDAACVVCVEQVLLLQLADQQGVQQLPRGNCQSHIITALPFLSKMSPKIVI